MIYELNLAAIEPIAAVAIFEVWREAARRFPQNRLFCQLETTFLSLVDSAQPMVFEINTGAASETDLGQVVGGALALARGFAAVGGLPNAVQCCEVIARLAADAMLTRFPSRKTPLSN